jgi:hypothetical protein
MSVRNGGRTFLCLGRTSRSTPQRATRPADPLRALSTTTTPYPDKGKGKNATPDPVIFSGIQPTGECFSTQIQRGLTSRHSSCTYPGIGTGLTDSSAISSASSSLTWTCSDHRRLPRRSISPSSVYTPSPSLSHPRSCARTGETCLRHYSPAGSIQIELAYTFRKT